MFGPERMELESREVQSRRAFEALMMTIQDTLTEGSKNEPDLRLMDANLRRALHFISVCLGTGVRPKSIKI